MLSQLVRVHSDSAPRKHVLQNDFLAVSQLSLLVQIGVIVLFQLHTDFGLKVDIGLVGEIGLRFLL